MASLKDLRLRIRSIKSTQKITAAMKMVAAAKLRRAQEKAVAARPYGERIERLLHGLACQNLGAVVPLLSGNGRDLVHLLVVASSDRGLAGAFNASIAREARARVKALLAAGKTVKILCIGRKARDILRRDHGPLIIETMPVPGRGRASFSDASLIADKLRALFESGEVDCISLVYARFRSAISQTVMCRSLIPLAVEAMDVADAGAGARAADYDYEPGEEQILNQLVLRNLAVQIFGAFLENDASFQGAQMTAMDNATRNAGDIIKRLTLNYNRTRQAVITKELIEIISGAEAM